MNKILISLLLSATLTTISKQPSFLTHPSSHAQELLQSMTLRQKIGQLFMVAATSIFYAANNPLFPTQQDCPYKIDSEHIKRLIRDYHIGGLIFLFKSEPDLQIAALHMYQKEAKIPLLIGQDLEWGLSQSLDHDPSKVTRYPHLMTLGALSKDNEYLIYEFGQEIGKQCAQIGVHINFAPVADVNNNPANPVIHDRSFGDDPAKVARLAILYMQGLQDAGIIACAKHFPGHGDVSVDSHEELPRLDHARNRLDTIELLPFKALIDAGVGAVMNAHLEVPAFDAHINRPSSMSHRIVTQLLRDELHFQGLAITDGLGMKAITNHYKPGELELEAFLAGNDILLCPLDVPHAVDLIEKAIKDGRVSEKELDRRVLKILHAKEWAFAQQRKHITHDPLAFLIRPEACALQEQLYRKTITIARNNLSAPFGPDLLEQSCIMQIGGTKNEYVPSNINASAALTNDEVNACLSRASDHDTVIILLNGMNKFAHKNFGISPHLKSLLSQLKERGKQIIIVVFGSPYSICNFDNADAVILAYAYKETPALWKGVRDLLIETMRAEGRLPVAHTEISHGRIKNVLA
jgi:beta-N-acetylhexosaminidase